MITLTRKTFFPWMVMNYRRIIVSTSEKKKFCAYSNWHQIWHVIHLILCSFWQPVVPIKGSFLCFIWVILAALWKNVQILYLSFYIFFQLLVNVIMKTKTLYSFWKCKKRYIFVKDFYHIFASHFSMHLI